MFVLEHMGECSAADTLVCGSACGCASVGRVLGVACERCAAVNLHRGFPREVFFKSTIYMISPSSTFCDAMNRLSSGATRHRGLCPGTSGCVAQAAVPLPGRVHGEYNHVDSQSQVASALSKHLSTLAQRLMCCEHIQILHFQSPCTCYPSGPNNSI